MTKAVEPITMTKAQSAIKGIDLLKNMHEATMAIKKSCMQIKITSDDELDVANDKIKKAKKIKKEIDDKRKKLTGPINDQKKAIMDFAKKLMKPVEEGIQFGSDSVISYNKKVEEENAKKIKELEEKQKGKSNLRDEICKCEDQAYDDLLKVDTMEGLQKVFNHYIKRKDGEAIFQIIEECEDRDKAIGRIRAVGKGVKDNIQGIIQYDIEGAIKEIQEKRASAYLVEVDEEEVEDSKALAEAKTRKSSGVVKMVSFELDNIDEVPDEYKMVIINEEMIKAYMKNNKKDKDLVKEQPIPGIKFFIKEHHRS